MIVLTVIPVVLAQRVMRDTGVLRRGAAEVTEAVEVGAGHRGLSKEEPMSATTTQYKIFVGGEWADAASGETMEVINPATGETIAEVPRCGAEDVDRAVEAAKKALPEWLDEDAEGALRAPAQARRRDRRARRGARAARVAERRQAAHGVARRDAVLGATTSASSRAPPGNLEGKSAGEYIEGYTSMIRREPLGIVGGICPWNYPLMMAIWKMGPALAAGNVQILKPSEQTPLSLLRFVQLAQEVIPAGRAAGRDRRRRAGRRADRRASGRRGSSRSPATSRPARRSRATRPTRSSASISSSAARRRWSIFDDADPKAVAEGIRLAGYWNSGQDCTAGSRVIAGPKIYDKLLEELVPQVESLKVGDPMESDEIEMGSVISHGAAGADPRLPRAREGRDDPHRRRHERRAAAASSSSRRSSPT